MTVDQSCEGASSPRGSVMGFCGVCTKTAASSPIDPRAFQVSRFLSYTNCEPNWSWPLTSGQSRNALLGWPSLCTEVLELALPQKGLSAHQCSPLFASCPTRRKQDLSRNNASRMIAGPSPDLPRACPAGSPTCLARQPLANNLGHDSEQRYPLAALQPHITVILVVHALPEQASLTLPGSV